MNTFTLEWHGGIDDVWLSQMIRMMKLDPKPMEDFAQHADYVKRYQDGEKLYMMITERYEWGVAQFMYCDDAHATIIAVGVYEDGTINGTQIASRVPHYARLMNKLLLAETEVPPQCLGHYLSGSIECDGDGTDMEPPCTWSERCSVLLDAWGEQKIDGYREHYGLTKLAMKAAYIRRKSLAPSQGKVSKKNKKHTKQEQMKRASAAAKRYLNYKQRWQSIEMVLLHAGEMGGYRYVGDMTNAMMPGDIYPVYEANWRVHLRVLLSRRWRPIVGVIRVLKDGGANVKTLITMADYDLELRSHSRRYYEYRLPEGQYNLLPDIIAKNVAATLEQRYDITR